MENNTILTTGEFATLHPTPTTIIHTWLMRGISN